MKQLIFLLLSTFSYTLYAQIPVSTPPNDQLLQGPCYIFTVIAALESKAIESGYSSDVDFYEWNLYSTDVLGGITGGGENMVTKAIAHARTAGVYDNSAGTVPANIDELPNNDDLYAAGIAGFELPCDPSFDSNYYEYAENGEGACTEFDEEIPQTDLKYFNIHAFSTDPYVYQTNGGLGYVHDNDPTETEIIDHLNNDRGLIVLFSDWDNPFDNDTMPRPHSIFIYGKVGNSYKYKDSWPGYAANKTGAIDFSHCTDIYYLTGSIAPPVTCQGSIVGPSLITGLSTFDLVGGNFTNIRWQMPKGLVLETQNSPSSINVRPMECKYNSTSISVTYFENGVECTASFNVTINTLSQTPDDILVMSPNWDNGQTCPGVSLPLEALDNSNPPFPTTTYDWSIAGATPQGSTTSTFPYLEVITQNSIENVYLTFKVRAQRGNCPASDWVSISGISSPSNCGGGGDGGKIVSSSNDRLTFANLDRYLNDQTELQYQIVSINGQVLQKGSMPVFDPNIDISSLNDHFIFIHLYSKQGDFQQTFKQAISR